MTMINTKKKKKERQPVVDIVAEQYVANQKFNCKTLAEN